MRGRRGPISFKLVEGASKEELRRVRDDLTRQLKHAIALALKADGGVDSIGELQWKPSRSDDQSVWFATGEVQLASTSIGGTRRVSFLEGPRGYARLIPTFPSHSDDTVEKFAGDTGHPMFFGMSGGIWYGPAAHGFLIFPALPDQNTPVHGATKWFDDNGEFWGFSTGFFYEEQDGKIGLAYTRLVGFWKSFLSRHARLSAAHGAQGPYHFRVGLTSLAGTVWPRSAYDFDDPRREALIDKVEFAGQFSKPEPDILEPLLRTAINKVRAAYGLSNVSDAEFARLMLEN